MKDIITFPVLRMLKGKYGLSVADLAKVTGDKCYQTFTRKMDYVSEFSFSDMLKIKAFFESKGEQISIEKLFFDWIYTDEFKDIRPETEKTRGKILYLNKKT